jgi:hypothetical protein
MMWINRFPIHKAHILKQKVTLCGHDSMCFGDSHSTFARIHRFVDENFTVGDVRPLSSASTAGMDSITAETRVLTPRENNVWVTRLEDLTSFIDPDNVLRSIVGGGKYQFTEDNVVQYSQMIPDKIEG